MQDAAMPAENRERLSKSTKKKKKKETSEKTNASEGCFRSVQERRGRGRQGGWKRGMSFEQPPASQCRVNKVRSSLGDLGLNSNHNKKVNRVIPVR